MRRVPQLRKLVALRHGVDGQTPLMKCLEAYAVSPRVELRSVFELLLKAADADALNMTDSRAQYTTLMWAISQSFGSTALLDMLFEREDLDVSRALALLCSAYTRADVKTYFEELCRVRLVFWSLVSSSSHCSQCVSALLSAMPTSTSRQLVAIRRCTKPVRTE